MTKLLLLAACLFCFFAQAQKLKFDDKGNVVQLPKDYNIDSGRNVNLDNFKALTKVEVEKAKKIIAEQIGNAVELLADSMTGANKFYSLIWTDLPDFQKELQAFKDYVDNGTPPNPPLRILKTLKDEYDLDLALLTNMYHANAEPGPVAFTPYEIRLKRTNPYKKFQTDLYQKSYNDAGNALIKTLRPLGLAMKQNQCQAIQDSIDRLLKKANKSIDADMLMQLRSYDTVVGRLANYSGMLAFFQINWFKQWFGLSGGNLKLNPLKFTNDAYLVTSTKTDTSKVKLYEAYIDSIVRRRIRKDTSSHLREVDSLLTSMGTGKKHFTSSDAEELKQENQDAMNDLLSQTETINAIRIPIGGDGKPLKHIALTTERQISDPNQKIKATEAVYVDSIKLVVLHNVPKDYILYLKETDKKLELQPAFSDILDTAINYKKLIATVTTVANPLLASLNAVVPTVYPKIRFQPAGTTSQYYMLDTRQPTRPRPRGVMLMYTNETFKEITEKAIRQTKTFDQTTYDAVLALPAYAPIANKKMIVLEGTNRRNLYDKFIEDYKKAFKLAAEAALQNLSDDSLVYDHFSAILESPLPPKLPAIKENKEAAYSSQFDFTHSAIEPEEKNVQVMMYKGKDSTTVTNFSYKIDKGRRVQLSAGIVYTIAGLDQTKVDGSNGEIKISNNSQKFRMLAGVNVYFKKGLFVENKSLIGDWSRLSAFAGVGIPDPLGNLYLGFGYDLIPGARVITGVHLYRYTKYSFLNNTISDKQNIYRAAGPFVSVAIDPSSFIKALGLF